MKQDGIDCQGPTPPPQRFQYLRETISWRSERGGGEGGVGGGGENVHLLTHIPARGMSKNTGQPP